jgi:hypothetical protein
MRAAHPYHPSELLLLDPFESREKFWLPYITDVMKVDSNTVLIGHSTGGDAVLRLLETTKALGTATAATGRRLYTYHTASRHFTTQQP